MITIKISDPVRYRTDGIGFDLSAYNQKQIEDMMRRILLENSLVAREIEVKDDQPRIIKKI